MGFEDFNSGVTNGSQSFTLAGMASAVAVVKNPIEELRWVSDEDGNTFQVSDVNLLLNVERIKNELGEAAYLNIVRSITPSRSPYKEKMDDDLLLKTLKSRYIQSPTEMEAWMSELTDRVEALKSEVNEERRAQLEAVQQQQQQQQEVEPAKSE